VITVVVAGGCALTTEVSELEPLMDGLERGEGTVFVCESSSEGESSELISMIFQRPRVYCQARLYLPSLPVFRLFPSLLCLLSFPTATHGGPAEEVEERSWGDIDRFLERRFCPSVRWEGRKE